MLNANIKYNSSFQCKSAIGNTRKEFFRWFSAKIRSQFFSLVLQLKLEEARNLSSVKVNFLFSILGRVVKQDIINRCRTRLLNSFYKRFLFESYIKRSHVQVIQSALLQVYEMLISSESIWYDVHDLLQLVMCSR